MTATEKMKAAKFVELVNCIEDLQERLVIIHTRALAGELYGPVITRLALDVDRVMAQLHLLEALQHQGVK